MQSPAADHLLQGPHHATCPAPPATQQHEPLHGRLALQPRLHAQQEHFHCCASSQAWRRCCRRWTAPKGCCERAALQLPWQTEQHISASPQQRHARYGQSNPGTPLQALHKLGLPDRLRRCRCQCLYCTSSEAHAATGDHATQPRFKGWQPCCKFLIQRIAAAMGVDGFRPVACKKTQIMLPDAACHAHQQSRQVPSKQCLHRRCRPHCLHQSAP